MYEIRDPVHQTIAFSEKERAVIDHPIFQRMRYVRQLGLSYLVYPGSTHDRFSHMLGASHIAGRVWDNIVNVSGDLLRKYYSTADLAYFRQVIRFAALLHDVGHAPFSHVSEKLMPPFGELEIPRRWYIDPKLKHPAHHEDYSVMMIAAIGNDPSLKIGPDMAQDIASLLHHGVKPSVAWQKKYARKTGNIHRFLSSFISGEIDVDRMDYLLRDAHFTGVAYGVYDMDHLVRNLGVTLRGKEFALTVDSTAVRAFEDFLLARYHMFLQVYHHKTTTSFDYFLKQAFANGEVQVHIPGTVEGYLDLRDSTFLEALFEAAQDPKNVWSRRFVYRKPAKRLFAASGDNPGSREFLRSLRKALTKAKVPHFMVSSHQYLSKLDSLQMRRRKGEAELLVREKRLGEIIYTPIQRYSSLLKKYNEALDIVNLYVLPEHYQAALGAAKRLK
jgi:HD superfamily phosphohydrolase